MNSHANTIAIGRKSVRAIEIPFENFWIVSFDVFVGNDDFNLRN